MADEFVRGAKDAGHEVLKIELKEKEVKDCMGCGICQTNGGKYVQKDDMAGIYIISIFHVSQEREIKMEEFLWLTA